MDNEEPDRGNFDVHVGIGLLIVLAVLGLAVEAVWLLVDLVRGASTSNIPSM